MLNRLAAFIVISVLLQLSSGELKASPLPGFRLKEAKTTFPITWKKSDKSSLYAANTKKTSRRIEEHQLIPLGGQCKDDEECVAGSWCDDKSKECRKLYTPINMLYLFYYSGDRRFMEVLGLFWRKTGNSGYNVLFPLYWHFYHKKKTKTARVIFPLFWRFTNQEKKYANTFVLPFQYRRTPDEKNYRLWPIFFWTNYGKKGAGLTVFPIFHRSRRGSYTSTIAPFLLTGYASDPKRQYSRGLVLGLYYWLRQGAIKASAEHKAQPKARADALFPLFYDKTIGKEKRFSWFFPLNFYKRNHDKKEIIAFPVFYYQKTTDKSDMLGPIFYYKRRYNHKTFVSPLYLYEKDKRANLKHWGLVIPPYYHRRDSEREVDTLLGLFWRWHDRVENKTTWIAGPIVTQSDPDGGSQIFFPFFWRFKDKKSNSSSSFVFPLFAYHHRKGKKEHSTLVFPFYYAKKKSGYNASLLPLFYIGSDSESRHAVLFPLFWHLKNKKRTLTAFANIYYYGDAQGYQSGLWPLISIGKEKEKSHQVVFPLFWHFRDSKKHKDKWVAFPFFHFSEKNKGSLTGVFPLFASGRWNNQRYLSALFPLFYYRKDLKTNEHTTVAGLYWSYERQKEKDIREKGYHIFPLAFYRKSYGKNHSDLRTGVLPFFYYRNKNDQNTNRKTLITPLGGYLRDNKKKKTLTVLPLYACYQDKKEKRQTEVFFPLFYRHKKEHKKATVLFPLYWDFKNTKTKERSQAIFPLYWHSQEASGYATHILFPLFWRVRGKEHATTVAGPLFWHHDSTLKRRGWGLLPLAMYHKTKKSSWLFSLPFIWYDHQFAKKQKTYVFGPGYFRSYQQKEEKGYATGVAPLFFMKRSPKRSYTFLFPLVWHYGNPQKDRSWLIAGPYFQYRAKSRRGLGVFPLFYSDVTKKGEKGLAVFPLFYNVRSKDRFALYTPLFGYDKNPERKHLYAGPYFRSRGKKKNIDILFPLYWGFRTNTKSEYARTDVVFPLFWRHKDIDHTNTVVFPFFWDFNDRFASRTTAVLPFFIRHRDHLAQSTSWYTPPLFWFRFKKDGNDAVLFPLIWHYGGKKKSTTVGFPLYWDFKRKNKRSTVFFPLFWRFDRKDARTYFVINTYYRRSKRNNTYDFWFFPLVRVQRPRVGDFNLEIIFNLFGYKRVGRNRILSLFFFPFELSPAKGKAPALNAAEATLDRIKWRNTLSSSSRSL